MSYQWEFAARWAPWILLIAYICWESMAKRMARSEEEEHPYLKSISAPPEPSKVQQYVDAIKGLGDLDGHGASSLAEISDKADLLWSSMTLREHDEARAAMVGRDYLKPKSIIFFPNGTAAVCDQQGCQMGRFNGKHQEAVVKLRDAGVDWRSLDVLGKPEGEA
jgi:hypothetical protein